jgi:hypothetical protein
MVKYLKYLNLNLNFMNLILSNFIKFFKESLRDLLPIVLVVIFFQLIVINKFPENFINTCIWLTIVAIWLSVFLMWLKYGVFPIWEKLTKSFTYKKYFYLLIFFWFFIWFSTTIAEPALYIIANKATIISDWKINAEILRIIVALAVWISISIWILWILKWIPIHIIIIIWYILTLCITYFTPYEIIWLAYDLWWVTTSTITVPLVTAIWIWIAKISQRKNPLIDWFWLIACASLLPIIFVQIYWIFIYNLNIDFIPQNELIEKVSNIYQNNKNFSLINIIKWLFSTIIDIIPILLTIFFFQYIILKEKIPINELKNIIYGFLMVIIWLYFFILWLVSLWEEMALELTWLNNYIVIYLFAFCIGFSTTMAEPTLIAISNKSSEISNWKINAFILRIFVAIWVWIWITIWVYRIIYGDLIHYYIIIWYIIVIILTYYSPKYIVPIAYDSWWVTTSTITVPLIASIWLWIATNIPNRDPMIDWFWLIALASLFPIITVLLYGIISKFIKIEVKYKYKKILKHDEVELNKK